MDANFWARETPFIVSKEGQATEGGRAMTLSTKLLVLGSALLLAGGGVFGTETSEGYVAYMYLTGEAGPFRPKAEAPVQPINGVAQNGVMRWNAGAAGCEQFTSDGHVMESATV